MRNFKGLGDQVADPTTAPVPGRPDEHPGDRRTLSAVERIADLCRPFVQVENVLTRRHHGSGMGLFISKGIVTQHGGCIYAENNPAGGATFTVVLPRKQ